MFNLIAYMLKDRQNDRVGSRKKYEFSNSENRIFLSMENGDFDELLIL
jgi:hypothetical protein